MRKILLSFGFLLLVMSLFADVTVVKRALNVNPKLYFRGISGNNNFSNYVKSDLRDCGWFDITYSQNDAKYIVSGRIEGSKAILMVSGAASFGLTLDTNASNLRLTAGHLVDALLRKLFRVPGICTSKIAFAGQAGRVKEIYLCDFNGTDVKRLTNNKSLSIDPNWGMNNKMLAYTYYHNNYTDLVGYELANRKTYYLAKFPGLNTGGAISPNGKYLALILSKDKQVDLYVKKIYGNGIKRLTKDIAVEGSPCWSPNGLQICFVSDEFLGIPKPFIIDVNSGRARALKIVGSSGVSPDWSPLGNKIVYSAKFGKQYTLAVYDIGTASSSTININAAGSWMSPSWAPDGRHVICERVLNYSSQLYIVDTWTGKTRQLLNSKMSLGAPSWSQLF